jgi:hypothetical protein
MNPVCQLYSIVLDQLSEHRKHVKKLTDWETVKKDLRKSHPDPVKAADRLQTLREKEVEALVFAPILRKLDQRNNNDAKKAFVSKWFTKQ